MDKKKLMLLLGAMVVAIGTALAARSMLSGATAPAVQAAMPIIAPKGPRVLVAQRALPPGTIITADAIGFQEWPGNMVRDAYFVDGKVNMNKLIGTVVRFPITAGQPLTNGALVAPGDRGFLAAALAPGMRAITITVSEKSGVAGFIFPGDHVDVMLTQTVKGSGMDSQGLSATETVLRNIRVLATDQSTETESANGKTLVHTFHTVTVEVTPKIAEKVEVAQAIGALSLTLRPLADNQAELDRAIASGSVKLGDGAHSAGPSEAQMLAAARSPMDGGSTMTTGGEVSRFQPKRMPMGGAVAAAPAMPGQPSQPHFANGVRVTRGNTTITVETSAASQAGAFNAALAGGAGNAGQAVGSINPATAALR